GDMSHRRVVPTAEGRKHLRERDPLAGAVDLRMAARICSHSVVPERGMPTMNTGTGSALLARALAAKRARSNSAMLALMKALCSARENGWKRRSSAWPVCQWLKAVSWSFWPDQNFARS